MCVCEGVRGCGRRGRGGYCAFFTNNWCVLKTMCKSACVYVSVCVVTCVDASVLILPILRKMYVFVCICLQACVCMCMNACACACECACACVCAYACVCACVCACVIFLLSPYDLAYKYMYSDLYVTRTHQQMLHAHTDTNASIQICL